MSSGKGLVDQGSESVLTGLRQFKKQFKPWHTNMPDTFQGFDLMYKSAFREGEISKKHKELMAVALSVSSMCKFCVIVHSESCVNRNVSKEEFLEACQVPIEMGIGNDRIVDFASYALLSFDTIKSKRQCPNDRFIPENCKDTEKYQAILQQYDVIFAEGALPLKIKELIALILAMNTKRPEAIVFHTRRCIDHGISRKEIFEALEFVIQMGSGIAAATTVPVLATLEEIGILR